MKKTIFKGIIITVIATGVIASCAAPNENEKLQTKIESAETYEERMGYRLDGVEYGIKDHATLPDQKVVFITAENKGHDNYSMRRNATELLESAFKEPMTQRVRLSFVDESVDQYGNKGELEVYIVDMERETADKVQWENFDYDKLPIVADEWIHAGWRDDR